MTKIKLNIGVVVLVSILSLLCFLPGFQTNEVNAAALTQEANQEKQSILQSIAAGQVLYMREEQYEKHKPSTDGHPWRHPENIQVETWMAADSNGRLTTYSTAARSLDGDLLSYSMIENGNLVFRMVANGEELSVPLQTNHTLPARLESIWRTGERLSGDSEYSSLGAGQWNGKQTAIFEDEVTIPLPTPQDIVYRNEHVVDKPLLFSSSIWEKDADGTRTRTSERRIVEYQLLPADTQIGPFTNDGS